MAGSSSGDPRGTHTPDGTGSLKQLVACVFVVPMDDDVLDRDRRSNGVSGSTARLGRFVEPPDEEPLGPAPEVLDESLLETTLSPDEVAIRGPPGRPQGHARDLDYDLEIRGSSARRTRSSH